MISTSATEPSAHIYNSYPINPPPPTTTPPKPNYNMPPTSTPTPEAQERGHPNPPPPPSHHPTEPPANNPEHRTGPSPNLHNLHPRKPNTTDPQRRSLKREIQFAARPAVLVSPFPSGRYTAGRAEGWRTGDGVQGADDRAAESEVPGASSAGYWRDGGSEDGGVDGFLSGGLSCPCALPVWAECVGAV